MTGSDEKTVVENINTPGKTSRVNAAKYGAMRSALMTVFSSGSGGLTQAEMMERVKPLLPEDLFPGGKTSGWWVKTVQLDLEAKGILK
ncbi:MAG: hypothetical protein AAFX02_03700, partial [Pseudomonadota bacterium]